MKRILGFLFSASLGALYGLFFAQKSGQKLRTDLKKAKNPTKELFKELKSVASESGKEAAQWAENSAELQTLLDEARNYFDELVEKSKGVRDATAESISEELAELGEKASAAAKKVKASATQQATKFKNELEKEVKKEVKTVAKKLKK
jgi:gas vesicle protein